MTNEEKLLFHRDGYLIFRNVLTPEQIERMNAVADEKESFPEDNGEQREFFVCKWGPDFQALIDHPRIVPYLKEFVGPKFRLDHDYCIFMKAGTKGRKLHGGESRFTDFWYRRHPDGTIRSGMTVVTYFLTDANEDDGGFVVIPGSHRDNFIDDLPEDVRYLRRRADYLVQPTFKAGDVVIFPEGVIHGTTDWNGKQTRRVLLYKYCPGHIAWLGNYYDADELENVTELQRQILRPPYVDIITPPNGSYRTDTL